MWKLESSTHNMFGLQILGAHLESHGFLDWEAGLFACRHRCLEQLHASHAMVHSPGTSNQLPSTPAGYHGRTELLVFPRDVRLPISRQCHPHLCDLVENQGGRSSVDHHWAKIQTPQFLSFSKILRLVFSRFTIKFLPAPGCYLFPCRRIQARSRLGGEGQ